MKLFCRTNYCILISLLPALFLAWLPAASAEDLLTVRAGEVNEFDFSDFNYHESGSFYDPASGYMPADPVEIEASPTDARISVYAGPGMADELFAEAGILFELDPGPYKMSEISDWPVSITVEFSYWISAAWSEGTGLAVAAVSVPDFMDESYDIVFTTDSQGTPSLRFDTGLEGQPLLAGHFQDPGQAIVVAIQAQASTQHEAGASVVNSAQASLTLERIIVEFPGNQDPTTTTTAFGKTTTTTTIAGRPTTTTTGKNSSTTTTGRGTTTTTVPRDLEIDFVGKPRSGEAPLNVRFFATASGEVVDGFWDFGDGTTGTGQSPEHTYHEPGSYTVVLTAYDAAGNEVRTVREDYIDVFASEIFADAKASPLEGHAPLTVQFEDRSSGEIVSWLWDFGDGQSSEEQNPRHVYEQPGEYTVVLSVADSYGATDTREFVNAINVFDDPLTPDFSAEPRNGMAPLTVQFNDISQGEPEGWIWHFGDGQYSDEQSPQHTYAAPGTYAVGLRIFKGDRIADAFKEAFITVQPDTRSFSVSGTVSGSGSAPVHVFLFGEDVERMTPMEDDGTYSFEGVKNGFYAVAPFSEGLEFDTPYREVAVQNGDVADVDFSAQSLGPQILSFIAEPQEVPADGSTPLYFVAQVYHPQGLETIGSVRLNLTPVGAEGWQDMKDDGTGADDVAGDGVYTLQTTVDESVPPGPKGVFLQVSDAAGKKAVEVFELKIKRSITGTVTQNGSEKKSFENEIEGQTLDTSYALQGGGSNRVSAAVENTSLLLQLLDPDNEPYFDSPLEIKTQQAQISVQNAAKGTWTFEIQNQGAQSRQYSLSVGTSGTGVITGAVFDVDSGSGIDDALVSTNGGVSTVTDEGYYALLHPAGVFSVQASVQTGGYSTASQSVTVSTGTTQEVNMGLRTAGSSDNSSGNCLFASVLHGRNCSASLDTLRAFRDVLLKPSYRGRQYIALYYRYSPELVRLVAKNPQLARMLRVTAGQLMPRALSALRTGSIRLSYRDKQRLTACLGALSVHASPALQKEIRLIREKVEADVLFR